MDQPYSEGSLNKQILKEIRGVLTEANIIDVEIPEEERRHRGSMIYWVVR